MSKDSWRYSWIDLTSNNELIKIECVYVTRFFSSIFSASILQAEWGIIEVIEWKSPKLFAIKTTNEDNCCFMKYTGLNFYSLLKASDIFFDLINDYQSTFVFHSISKKNICLEDIWNLFHCLGQRFLIRVKFMEFNMDETSLKWLVDNIKKKYHHDRIFIIKPHWSSTKN